VRKLMVEIFGFNMQKTRNRKPNDLKKVKRERKVKIARYSCG